MDLKKWKDIADLVGLAAIVASLIFVGLQMRQSHDIALASHYQARAQATMESSLTHMEVGYVPPPLRAGLSETVTASSINSFLWMWIHMDNHYYQYQAGFMELDAWQPQLNNIKAIYGLCEMRFVYEWRKAGLRSDFNALVESLDDPCADDPS